MEFQFCYEYTSEDMEVLSRASAKTFGSRRARIYRLILALLCLVYIGMGSRLTAEGDSTTGAIIMGGGMIFGGVAIFYHRVAAWRSKRRVTAGMGAVTITLEEKGIRGKSKKGEDLCPYDAVVGAVHYRKRYLLFVDARRAILLPERALVRGELADVAPFLKRKMKQEIHELS